MKRLLPILLLPLAILVGCGEKTSLDTPDQATTEYLRTQAEGDAEGFCRVLTRDSQQYMLASIGARTGRCAEELRRQWDVVGKLMSDTAQYLRVDYIDQLGPDRARVFFQGSDGETTRDLLFEDGAWRVDLISGP